MRTRQSDRPLVSALFSASCKHRIARLEFSVEKGYNILNLHILHSGREKREDRLLKIWDITRELNEESAIYEGDPRFSIVPLRTIEDDGYKICKMSMGTHAGTHLDAPDHYIDGGKRVCDISLRQVVGECVVLESIADYDGAASRVLIKGEDSRLDAQQAEYLVERHVTLVGTEALSIGKDSAHRILLGSGCVLLETLDLSKVAPGRYFLSAAPLKIEADGSPVRAFLMEIEDA